MTRISTLLVSFALAALGPMTNARAEAVSLQGVYTLPMASDLAPFASFQLPRATWETQGDTVVLTYYFPEDLTGTTDYSMTMIGDAREAATGDFFKMTCFRTGTVATCSDHPNGKACVLNFKNLGLDDAKIDQFLDAKYGKSPTTELRKRAAAVARSDAVGVLSLQP